MNALRDCNNEGLAIFPAVLSVLPIDTFLDHAHRGCEALLAKDIELEAKQDSLAAVTPKCFSNAM